jgi:hypothetical protein
MKTDSKVLVLLSVAIFLFFWKITLSSQFTLLVEHTLANGAYANMHYAAVSIKDGGLPAWDPYTHSGRPFVGDAENALFDPLRLIAYAWPLHRSGILSESLYNSLYVLAHLLAAVCMFLLARQLALSPLAAFVSALCFSVGGFMGRAIEPRVLDTALWLPLVLLLLLRALEEGEARRRLAHASLAGLAVAAALLAGGLDVAIMQAVVLISAAVYWQATRPRPAGGEFRAWVRLLTVLAVCGLIAVGLAAIQFFPALEYSRHAVRLLGTQFLPAAGRIPYSAVGASFPPRGLLGFLLPGFGGAENFTAYFGVLPLLLAVLGAWLAWRRAWTPYLVWLAVLSSFYTLGNFSFLHALGYTLLPFAWHMNDPGRCIYVTHFAAALLVGFGVERLFSPQAGDEQKLKTSLRAVAWVVAIAGGLLMLPAAIYSLQPDDQLYLWFLLLCGTAGLFWWILRGHRGRGAQVLLAALVLVELSAFAWDVPTKAVRRRAESDELQKLLSLRNAAAFLKAQPGVFRVQLEGDPSPGFGALFGVESVGGAGQTLLDGYQRYTSQVPAGLQMLNVRYLVRPARSGQPSLYSDGTWEVVEFPGGLPRAWLVHGVMVVPNREELFRRMSEPSFASDRMAIVESNPAPPVEARVEGAAEEVTVEAHSAGTMELHVRAASRALLVISELHYPGWRATLEGGASAPIERVNGMLRGIVVPAGETRVILRYAPLSLLAGAMTSLAALLAVVIIVIAARRRRSPTPVVVPARAPIAFETGPLGGKGVTAVVGGGLLLYLIFALPWISRPGPYFDEMLFLNGALTGAPPINYRGKILLLGWEIPTMLMPYLGATKGLLWRLIFFFWSPSIYSARVPIVILGGLGLLLFYLWARHFYSRTVAAVATLLAAADPSYIFPSRLDWGPVVFQRLLAAAGLLCAARWLFASSVLPDSWPAAGPDGEPRATDHRPQTAAGRHGLGWLAGAGFCFGLGLWDKATFIWFLFALGITLVILFPRQVLRCLRPRPAAVFFLALCAGAFPFILYNLSRAPQKSYEAVHFRFPIPDLHNKLDAVRTSLNGQFVYGWTGGYAFDPARAAARAEGTGKFLAWVNRLAPSSGTLLLWALPASLIMLWRRGRRAILFPVMVAVLMWVQALPFKEGGGPHHYMIAYPLPHLAVAAAAAALWAWLRPRVRFVAAAVLAAILLTEIGWDARTLWLFRETGGGWNWSDAIYGIAAYIKKREPKTVMCMDWGFSFPLVLLTNARLNQRDLYARVAWAKPGEMPSRVQEFAQVFVKPHTLYLFHVPAFQQFKNVRTVFDAALESAQMREKVLATFKQRNGDDLAYISEVVSASAPAPATESGNLPAPVFANPAATPPLSFTIEPSEVLRGGRYRVACPEFANKHIDLLYRLGSKAPQLAERFCRLDSRGRAVIPVAKATSQGRIEVIGVRESGTVLWRAVSVAIVVK